MADNFTQATQGASFPKPALKLYLYKIARNQPLWKFNHNFNGSDGLPGYVATGGDPADLDISSAAVAKALSQAPFARLPFDSWIPRQLDFQINPWTGSPENVGDLSKQPQAKAYFNLEDLDRANLKLSWKNIYSGQVGGNNVSGTKTYNEDFATFFADRKDFLIKCINSLLSTTDVQDAVNRYDLTTFIIKYTHDSMLSDIANILDIELASDPNAFFSDGTATRLASATNMGEFHSDDTGSGTVGRNLDSKIPVIEENDILELRVKYLDTDNSRWEIQESGFMDSDGFQRVFIGYVSSLVRTMQYNNQERVNIAATGVSKLFATYDTSFVPSIALGATGATGGSGVFESGIEMNDTRFSIWANNLNGKGTDDIFDYFMHAGLFCNKIGDAAGELPKMQAKLAAAKQDLATLAQERNTTDPVSNPQTSQGKSDLAAKVDNLTAQVASLTSTIAKQKATQLGYVFQPTRFPGAPDTAAEPPKKLDIEYYMPIAMQDSASTSFQFINYIPVLMSLARKYAEGDVDSTSASYDRVSILSEVMATVEQAGYIGYKAMMQTAYKLFYPELKRPADIFIEVKHNTFLELFEDRPGVIRLRPPKYNIINLNPEISEYKATGKSGSPTVNLPAYAGSADLSVKLNAEYVIPASAIMSMSVHQNDMSIVTRSDHTFETVFGAQALEGYTGHFTDAGYLMRYGLRTTGPQHSPMAISPKISAALSAVRVATTNAEARTITLTLFNTREYRLGRLYYIPISLPTYQEFNSSSKIRSKGIVGYVTKVTTGLSYAQEATHTVTLAYVRQADILGVQVQTDLLAAPIPDAPNVVYYANFKRLPDIATYMRLLASDKGFGSDAIKSIQSMGSDVRDAVSDNTTSTSPDGYMIIPNGMSKSDLSVVSTGVQTQSALYSDKLRGVGITKNVTAGDRNLQAEQNNFVTTIASGAIEDGGSVAMSKNLLAKLTTYDVDPLIKLYPTVISDFPTGPIDTRTNIPKLPNTESTQNRDVEDLMTVVFNLLRSAIDKKCYGRSSFDLNTLSRPPVQYTPGNKLAYMRFPASVSDPNTYSANGSTNLIKRNIFVGTETGGQFYQSRVVFAFVQTEGTGDTGAPNYNKFFVFHVPYDKSLRLSSMINSGAATAGGYRQLATVKKLSGNPKAKSDLHSDGNALVFTNIGASLWSFTDIINACIELDVAAPTVTFDATNPDMTEENSDIFHLFNSYINCMIEPHNYVSKQNECYNAYAVNKMVFNNEAAALILQDCWDASKSVANIKFSTLAVAEAAHSNEAESAVNYFKATFRESITNINNQLLVPINQDFFSTGQGGVGLFDKIGAQTEALPSNQFTTDPIALYTAVIKKFDVTYATKGNVMNIKPGSGGAAVVYLMHNWDQVLSSTGINPADINNLTFTLNLDKFPLVPSKIYTSMESFVNGSSSRPQYRMLCFHFIDNLPLLPIPKTTLSPAYWADQRSRIQGNALSNVWHTSYAQTTDTFQSPKAASLRQVDDKTGKLNLTGQAD